MRATAAAAVEAEEKLLRDEQLVGVERRLIGRNQQTARALVCVAADESTAHRVAHGQLQPDRCLRAGVFGVGSHVELLEGALVTRIVVSLRARGATTKQFDLAQGQEEDGDDEEQAEHDGDRAPDRVEVEAVSVVRNRS